MELEPAEEAPAVPAATLWAEVTPVEALGDRLKETISFSDKARVICDEHRDPAKEVELVDGQPWIDEGTLLSDSNKDMLNAAENGGVADFVRVAKITDPNHPGVLEANLLKDQQQRSCGYSLFVNKNVEKGTILGTLVGKICVALEAEDIASNAQDGETKLRELYFFELDGSLEDFGGWVTGSRLEQSQKVLLLDSSEERNILSIIHGVREDPYKTCSPPRTGVRGTANVKWVQIRINNIPRILVVASTDIEKNDELLMNNGEAQATASLNCYVAAKKLYDVQKFANELADKNEDLQDRLQSVTTKQVEDNRNVKLTRNVAMEMAVELKEMIGDNESDFDKISKDDIGSVIPTHLNGSLRTEVYESEYGDEEDLLAEKVSEHQSLIYDNDFTPKIPKEVERGGEKKIIYVDNHDCEEYMDIQAEDGQEIFQEVGRAWLEYQNLRSLTSGNQVPWNSKKRRLLDNDEVVMVLTAKLMEVTGHKPSELVNGNSDANRRRKRFRQIFNDLEPTTEQEDVHEETRRVAAATGK